MKLNRIVLILGSLFTTLAWAQHESLSGSFRVRLAYAESIQVNYSVSLSVDEASQSGVVSGSYTANFNGDSILQIRSLSDFSINQISKYFPRWGQALVELDDVQNILEAAEVLKNYPGVSVQGANASTQIAISDSISKSQYGINGVAQGRLHFKDSMGHSNGTFTISSELEKSRIVLNVIRNKLEGYALSSPTLDEILSDF